MRKGSMFSHTFQRIIDLGFDGGLFPKCKANSYYQYRHSLRKSGYSEKVSFLKIKHTKQFLY